MNKEISDSLYFLLHCALKDDEFETQREQFKIIYKYIENLERENQKLKKQNDSLKQKLNWIAFGDDSELALRYLRKIGYVDFDEERKVYINKHNNEPFLLKDEQEKDYYIKDNELNEYTEQLEYQIKELKKQLEEYKRLGFEHLNDKCNELKNQQKEFIEYMEDLIKQNEIVVEVSKYGLPKNCSKLLIDFYKEILSKYKEIINPSKKCPNPDGKEGICYQFDRFGDRAGCLGCELYTKEMFDKDDPLPGLTEKLKKIIGVSK